MKKKAQIDYLDPGHNLFENILTPIYEHRRDVG